MRAQSRFETSDAIFGEYEQRRIAREAAESARVAALEAARQRRAADEAAAEAQRQQLAREAAQRHHEWEMLKLQTGNTVYVLVHDQYQFVGGGNQAGTWSVDVASLVQPYAGHVKDLILKGALHIVGGPGHGFASSVALGSGTSLVNVHDGGRKWHSLNCSWNGQGVVYQAASGGWGSGGDGCTKHAQRLTVDIILDAQYGVPCPQ